jgi:hypothetical protein
MVTSSIIFVSASRLAAAPKGQSAVSSSDQAGKKRSTSRNQRPVSRCRPAIKLLSKPDKQAMTDQRKL